MFWGISLEAGKRYSQTVEKSFHISMAALNACNPTKGPVTVMVEVEKACYPLCTLHPDRIPQQALNYIFTEGEEVLFYTEGDLEVHLTGYLIDDPNPLEYSTDEEGESSTSSSSDDETAKKKYTKRPKKAKKESSEEENLASLISELHGLNKDNEGAVDLWLPRSARKRQRSSDTGGGIETGVTLTEKLLADDHDSEDDGDWQPGVSRKLSKKTGSEDDQGLKKEKQLDNSPSDVDSSKDILKLNSSLDKKVLSPTSKKIKKKGLKDKEVNSSNGCLEDSESSEQCTDKKADGREREMKMETQENEEKPHKDRKQLPGGTIIEDIVKGQGKKAKKGKQVSVYYTGTLKKSKKQFDARLDADGKPFTFRLGEGEVIKGWDVGVEGMHVGGKRKIIVPPSQGYVSKQMGSSIPPNSTLVFIVELVKVY